MILAIDVGNSNTVIGGLETEGATAKVIFSTRTKSNILKVRELLEKISKGDLGESTSTLIESVDGVIISSVIPTIVPQMVKVIHLIFGIEPIIVGPKMNMDIIIPERFHEELGPDIIVGLEAAADQYESPVAVIDLGTASTVFAIDKDKTFVGGTIHPGVGIELKSLCTNTAMLPRINFEVPQYVIGKNTAECIQSGVFYGHAGMIDTILDHMENEMGVQLNAVITGGLGRYIAPLCKRKIEYDEDLLLKGLYLLYKKNS